ncbi:MAG: ATP-binding protein [Flavobacteriaceae bacterium]|nr:ATP-binding protein [Flavobacteriaceae bacterium]
MEKTDEQIAFAGLRIVFFGPESTWKTTLSKTIAGRYDAAWVEEYAREYLQKKWDEVQQICTPEDIKPIVRGQLQRENEAVLTGKNLVVCDTNPLQTAVYEKYYFGKNSTYLMQLLPKLSYDFYFLCDIDTPWIADDLRDRPNQRQELFQSFKGWLTKRQLPFTTLSGSSEEKLSIADRHTQLLTQGLI